MKKYIIGVDIGGTKIATGVINKEGKLKKKVVLPTLSDKGVKVSLEQVYESIDKITISLICKKEENYLLIRVLNNYDPDSIPRKGKGIGLQNVNERLRLIYNQDNLLTYEKSENLFTANIYIPLEQ